MHHVTNDQGGGLLIYMCIPHNEKTRLILVYKGQDGRN